LQNGVSFWKGAGRAAFQGAVQGVMSFGIGTAFTPVLKVGEVLTNAMQVKIAIAQSITHGLLGGISSAGSGGKFWSGFASGAISSVVGSGMGQLGLTGVRGAAASILAGGLTGGISSKLAGGTFVDGMKNGLITAGLNHVAHWATSQINLVRENIARNAEKFVGQTDWAYNAEKDGLPSGTNKCSQFVYDSLKDGGINMGLPKGRINGYPYNAGDWGNPETKIPGWVVVSEPQRGDIVAYAHDYSDASGHVGFYTGNATGVWANSSIIRQDLISTWDSHGSPLVYRRFIGFSNTNNNAWKGWVIKF
jgi:hypothetical protein